MKKKLKIGLCGAGFISGYHFDCIRRVYGVEAEVIGIYDVVSGKAESFASSRNIRVFHSFDEMLQEVDVVTIGTPPSTHADLIVQAADKGKHIICEKPLIGFSPGTDDNSFRGIDAPKEPMLEAVLESLRTIRSRIENSGSNFCYFENLVYSPSLQKEREVIKKTGSQILRMLGEESHRGNHASYSSHWKYACGGSLISTGSHPIGALLYLKRVDGMAGMGKPIRPVGVSARIQAITQTAGYRNKGYLRDDYHDVEDYAWVHIDFEDGTVGDVVTGATVLGGIYDYVEVFANNHRTRCRMNPVNIMDVYNPGDDAFADVYLEYGLSSQMGWSQAVPDEYWILGYQHEMQDALESFLGNREPISGLDLAIDTTKVIYSAYLSAEKNGQKVLIQN